MAQQWFRWDNGRVHHALGWERGEPERRIIQAVCGDGDRITHATDWQDDLPERACKACVRKLAAAAAKQ